MQIFKECKVCGCRWSDFARFAETCKYLGVSSNPTFKIRKRLFFYACPCGNTLVLAPNDVAPARLGRVAI